MYKYQTGLNYDEIRSDHILSKILRVPNMIKYIIFCIACKPVSRDHSILNDSWRKYIKYLKILNRIVITINDNKLLFYYYVVLNKGNNKL